MKRHPLCLLKYDNWNGDYYCWYNTTLPCEECKYGMGRRDPEAKCNQTKESPEANSRRDDAEEV